MRPDGKPLQLSLDVMVTIQTWVDTAEIVASNLKSLGIDTEVKSEAMELFRQRTQSAAHDIALWSGDGGIECLLEPRWYFPYSGESLNAPLCQADGSRLEARKEKSPPWLIKEMMDTYSQILHTTSEEKRKELFQKLSPQMKRIYG